MSEKKGKIDDYKERQRKGPRDRWFKRSPRGLNRKGRRELAKRIRRAR